ncbi:MAG: hypothetical protein IJ565_00760 [Bacilli bacterium]|nr:hypothetical protein [Bacilli bacterium]
MLRVEKIIPVFNSIVTTANRYPSNGIVDEHGFIDVKRAGKLKEYQTILQVGPVAKNQGFKEGQKVFLNYIPYKKRKKVSEQFNQEDFTIEDVLVTLDDVPNYDVFDTKTKTYSPVLSIYDRDIICIVEGTEFEEKEADASDALEAKLLADKISKENHSGKGTKELIL